MLFMRSVLAQASLMGAAFALPQGGPPGGPAGGPPAGVQPTVVGMNMFGPGCPMGAGGTVQQIQNGTPVFLFPEWNLTLSDADPKLAKPSVDKFCQETISLANGPVGMQVRIATVSVGGWADLKSGSTLEIAVSTRLGSTTAGAGTVTVSAADLKNNEFDVSVATTPSTWSACVATDGKVPDIVIKTSLTLSGDSATNGSVVGSSNATDTSKALKLHFTPAWQPCAA